MIRFRIILNIDRVGVSIDCDRYDFRREENAEGTHQRAAGDGGFRFTPQRQHVYDVLLEKRDHPTAEEVFIRAKQRRCRRFPWPRSITASMRW